MLLQHGGLIFGHIHSPQSLQKIENYFMIHNHIDNSNLHLVVMNNPCYFGNLWVYLKNFTHYTQTVSLHTV